MFTNLDADESRVYLIDADTHAYRAAAATEGRLYSVGQAKFKYKKDATNHCKANNINIKEITVEFTPEPLENAIYLLKNSLEKFSGLNCRYYLTGNTNFRYSIDPNYKGNRKDFVPPIHLNDCRQYILNKHKALITNELEADDLVIMAAYELDKSKIDWTIVGCDKDLRQYPGTFLDPFTNTTVVIDKATARYNLWKQIATGDTTDNIITPRGLGPATFDKAFSGVDWNTVSEWDLFCMMMELYKRFVKRTPSMSEVEYTKGIMLWIKRTAQLVYLKRYDTDMWEIPTK